MIKLKRKDLKEILGKVYGTDMIECILCNSRAPALKSKQMFLKEHSIPMEFWEDVKNNILNIPETKEEKAISKIKGVIKRVCEKNELDVKNITKKL